jgi:hypothetical protein
MDVLNRLKTELYKSATKIKGADEFENEINYKVSELPDIEKVKKMLSQCFTNYNTDAIEIILSEYEHYLKIYYNQTKRKIEQC